MNETGAQTGAQSAFQIAGAPRPMQQLKPWDEGPRPLSKYNPDLTDDITDIPKSTKLPKLPKLPPAKSIAHGTHGTHGTLLSRRPGTAALSANDIARAAAATGTAAARAGEFALPALPALAPAKTERSRGSLASHKSPVDTIDMGTDDDGFGGSLGTAMQMHAIGPHNYVLDLNPETTFFKATYRRHTPGATETCEDAFDLVFGRANVVDIRRRGDVLGPMMLDVTVPNLGVPGGSWADTLGYVLFTRVRLLVDDVVVHDQERLWYDLWDKVVGAGARTRGLDRMVGRGRALSTAAAHSLTVPLLFARHLPIAALKRTARITVEVTAEALDNCVVGALPASTARPASLKARILSEQTFLSAEERRQVMARRHEVMVMQQQDTDALSYGFDDSGRFSTKAATVDLRELNLPVKFFAFVAYDETATAARRYFQYLDTISDATVVMGSRDRFAPRPGHYFALVQPYAHGGRCVADNVHVYSFALDMAGDQPSGALNFATVHKPTLRLGLRDVGSRALKLKVFAQCINWLVIDNGSASMMFT